MRLLKKDDTSKAIVFLMVDSTDHITGKTGLTPTVTISKNGGTFASPSGTVSEIGNGWYKFTPAAADVDTLGPLILHATASGADPVDVEYRVVAFDPDAATNLGLSYLDDSISDVPGLVWDELRQDHVETGSFGALSEWIWTDTERKQIRHRLGIDGTSEQPSATPSLSTLNAQQVWEYETRTLSAFGFSVAVATNSINAIADAVWDEATSGHQTAGTYGKTSEWTTTAAGVWGHETRTLSEFGFNVTVGGYEEGLSPGEQIAALGYTEDRAEKLDNLDAAITTRLAADAYVAPDNQAIGEIKQQTDKLNFTGEPGYELVLASAAVDVDEQAIADAVVAEIQDQNLVQVVVQPLVANVQRTDGDGGTITLWRYARLKASWTLDEDVSGHDLALIVYRPDTGVRLAECDGDDITITPQSTGCLVAVNAPDSLVPSAGVYAYVLRDLTTDSVLLSGQCIVKEAPDVAD